VFSIFYLKKRLYKHQCFAIFTVIIGFTLVSISTIAFVNPDQDDSGDKKSFDFSSVIGIICLFLSLMFQGFCYCYQENLLDTYEVNVMQMIGFESMVGAITSTVLMLIAMNINCISSEFCNKEKGFPIDSPPTAFYDLGFNNASLYFVLCCFSIMIFNLCGLTITKNAGAVFKVILDTLRTITVWIISVIIRFEDLKPAGKVTLELCGFILLILGNLIYNELLVLKFWGFDENTRKNRKKREQEDSYQKIESGKEEENSEILENKSKK
jgi:hypothetical protein